MAEAPASDLFTKLKSYVGKEYVFHGPEAIGAGAFRQYALSIEDFNPLYSDQAFAQQHGLRDVMAPPTLICDTWQFIEGDFDDRGELLGRGELRELTGLRAGNDYEFFQPLHPDDVITARWKVKDAYEKSGRSGVTIFLEFEITYYNQRDEMLARNTELMFHRP